MNVRATANAMRRENDRDDGSRAVGTCGQGKNQVCEVNFPNLHNIGHNTILVKEFENIIEYMKF